MAESRGQPHGADESQFARAARRRSSSFLGEFWRFATHNKKWWVVPVVITLLLVAVLVVLAATGAGPAIYTLF